MSAEQPKAVEQPASVEQHGESVPLSSYLKLRRHTSALELEVEQLRAQVNDPEVAALFESSVVKARRKLEALAGARLAGLSRVEAMILRLASASEAIRFRERGDEANTYNLLVKAGARTGEQVYPQKGAPREMIIWAELSIEGMELQAQATRPFTDAERQALGLLSTPTGAAPPATLPTAVDCERTAAQCPPDPAQGKVDHVEK